VTELENDLHYPILKVKVWLNNGKQKSYGVSVEQQLISAERSIKIIIKNDICKTS
jgi:hypothetical protein